MLYESDRFFMAPHSVRGEYRQRQKKIIVGGTKADIQVHDQDYCRFLESMEG